LLKDVNQNDFISFYQEKLDILFRTEEFLGFFEFKRFLPLANQLQHAEPKNNSKSNNNKNNSPHKKITKPLPFSFQETKSNTNSISKMKFDAMMEEKELKLKKIQNYKFIANPVPAQCLIPLLSSLDADRENRKR